MLDPVPTHAGTSRRSSRRSTSPEFAAAHERSAPSIARLGALYDEHGVRATDDARPRRRSTRCSTATNEVLDELRLVNAYVHAFVSTDARDDRRPGAGVGAAGPHRAAHARCGSRLDAWLASFDIDALARRQPVAADHAHVVRRAAVVGRRTSCREAEEDLAAELNLSGGSAWNQLHGDVSRPAHRRRSTASGCRSPPCATSPSTPTPASAAAAYDAELGGVGHRRGHPRRRASTA